MGRIATIENTAASGLAHYDNLKVIVRGRPRFLDPQLDGGTLRFAIKRGFNFSAIIPDNQSEIAEDAYKLTTRITMTSRPSWIDLNTLIRIGSSERIGELHIVRDLVDVSTIDVFSPLMSTYSADPDQDIIPVVSLIGTPCHVFAPVASPDYVRMMTIDSWYHIVPADILLFSETPDVLESLQEFPVRRAKLFGTRAGNTGIGEPATVYQYHIELDTNTGLLPFVPSVGLRLYLKALPLYFRGEWGTGDLEVPPEVGPCLFDAFFGSLLNTNPVYTKLGIQTWDAFGQQANADLTDDQQWQAITENYLMLERPISSDSMLFWQRITGNFQYQKSGYFQAELNEEGKFSFSTNLLVPKFPTDHEYGWVIPLFSRSPVVCVVQFEPQEQQVFQIPSNALTFVRPRVKLIFNEIATGIIPAITVGNTIITSRFPVTVNPGTDVFTTSIPHGFSSGMKTKFKSTGTLPSGLSAGTTYFIVLLSPTTFQVADTLERSLAGIGVIDVTDAGTGDLSCTDPNTNFVTDGILPGHFFTVGATRYEIAVVTETTLTLKTGFSSTGIAISYQIMEQDLTPIDRILISFKGSPNSRVEIRD